MSVRHVMGCPWEATVCACHRKQQCNLQLVVAFQRVGRVDSYICVDSFPEAELFACAIISFPFNFWQTCQSLAVKDCLGDSFVMCLGEISFHLQQELRSWHQLLLLHVGCAHRHDRFHH